MIFYSFNVENAGSDSVTISFWIKKTKAETPGGKNSILNWDM